MISVLILTWNEEVNLPGCLESVAWCDDVQVLDSLSTDRTREIARERGATVVERAFDNYAAQRNFGLALQFRHPWLLILDADERVPEDLREELQRTLPSTPESVCLYRLRRKDMLLGRWLRRSSGYPTWFGRVLRVGTGRYEREINEELFTDGEIRLLQTHLTHFPFNKGVSYWLERHNRYSSMEAVQLSGEVFRPAECWAWFRSGDPSLRRRAFKRFAYALPGRPLLTFCYLYFLRLGILDGLAGLYFSLLRAFYEFIIDLKKREHRNRQLNLPF